MNIYCTLFDSFYLTRGLSLIESLLTHEKDFKIYVFCFDEACFRILKKMSLNYVILISLEEFESRELLAVKKTRSVAEYCWTCTPFTIKYVMDVYGHNEVTYLDADLYFFAAPSIILQEFRSAKASILLTEHRYSQEYDQSKQSGIYCVQFITFCKNEYGLRALVWWRDRCLEWCFSRCEDGKFGDQKYLDDWKVRFEGVHVLKNLGGGVAPWNVQQYEISAGPYVNGLPIIFYHYHSLKIFDENSFDLSHYRISNMVIDFIYKPYTRALVRALFNIRLLEPTFSGGFTRHPIGLKIRFRSWKNKLLRKDSFSNFVTNGILQVKMICFTS